MTVMAARAAALAMCLAFGCVPAAQAASSVEGSGGGFPGGSLEVAGSGGNDTITVAYGDDGYTVTDPGGVTVQDTGENQACTTSGPTEARCRPDDSWPIFRTVFVSGGEGNDTLKSGYGHGLPDAGLPSGSFGISGGPGNDKLGGTDNFARDPNEGLDGGPGDDLLDGGVGEEFLEGGGGRDTIYGGPGQDAIADTDGLSGRAVDSDTYDGGVCPAETEAFCLSPAPDDPGGGDTIVYDGDAPVRLDLADEGPAQGREGEGDNLRNFCCFYTGAGDDTVLGGPLGGLFRTGAGDDQVDVSGNLGVAPSRVECGEGDDSLRRDHDDGFEDCESVTTLDQDADGIANESDNCPAVANPTQIDSDGDFRGDGCDSDDDNDGRPDASDACPLEAGSSTSGCPGPAAGAEAGAGPGGPINGSSADDTLVGTEGDDVINCGGGRDRVDGRGGNDVIRCGSGDDRVEGGSGDDRIDAGSGNDRVAGGSGKDRVVGASGKDHVSGGSGADRLRGGRGNDRVLGGAGGDLLIGNQGNDTLQGNSGNDRIAGGSGRDRLFGGAGRDRLDGGPGKDRPRP